METYSTMMLLVALKEVDLLLGGHGMNLLKDSANKTASDLGAKILRLIGKKSLKMLGFYDKESNHNHHVMLALRYSMVEATHLAREAMKEEGDYRSFLNALDNWILKERKQLYDFNAWSNWENRAIDYLALFFDDREDFEEKRQQMMTALCGDWLNYLHTQEGLAELPESFVQKIEQGWNYAGKDLLWVEIVISEFKAFLNYSGDDKYKREQARKSEKEFVQNFLTVIKLELNSMNESVEAIFPILLQIIELIKKQYPNQQVEVHEDWHIALTELSSSNTNLSRSVLSLQEQNKIQINLLQKEQNHREELDKKLAIAIAKGETDEVTITTLKQELKAVNDKVLQIEKMQPIAFSFELKNRDQLQILEKEFTLLELQDKKSNQDPLKGQSIVAAKAFHIAREKDTIGEYTSAYFYFHKAATLNPENAVYLNSLGNFLTKLSLYDKAINYLTQAEKIKSTDLELSAVIQNNLGATYSKNGNYIEALNSLKNAREIIVNISKYRVNDLANISNNIAMVHFKMKEYEAAKVILLQTINVFSNCDYKDPNLMARLYGNLGTAYCGEKDYEKAMENFEFALDIIDKTPLGDPHLIAGIYSDCGTALSGKGDDVNALRYLFKAVEIELSLFGESHSNIFTRFNNIGMAYRNLGITKKAIFFLERSLEIGISILGLKHPNVLDTIYNLHNTYIIDKDLHRALLFFEKNIGMNTVEFAQISTALGIEYSKNAPEISVHYLLRALSIYQNNFPNDITNMNIVYTFLGRSYLSIANYDLAIKYNLKAIEFKLQESGENTIDLANCYHSLGIAWVNKSNDNIIIGKGIRYMQKALAIFKDCFEGEDPAIINIKKNIEVALTKSKKVN